MCDTYDDYITHMTILNNASIIRDKIKLAIRTLNKNNTMRNVKNTLNVIQLACEEINKINNIASMKLIGPDTHSAYFDFIFCRDIANSLLQEMLTISNEAKEISQKVANQLKSPFSNNSVKRQKLY